MSKASRYECQILIAEQWTTCREENKLQFARDFFKHCRSNKVAVRVVEIRDYYIPTIDEPVSSAPTDPAPEA